MEKRTNIRKVDRAALRHLEDVKIDASLPCELRIRSYLQQIGNPYCYLDGDTVVSLGFSDTGITRRNR